MADILHRVGIKSSSDEVYKALATREGLAVLVDERHARGNATLAE